LRQDERVESKVFFASTLEAAKKDARAWLAQQTDVLVTDDINHRQSASGGWMVTITFQKKPRAN
jgi:hypothetical protein